MKEILQFEIQVADILDLITNSSSELFVLRNKMTAPILSDLVNEALKGYMIVSPGEFEPSMDKEEHIDPSEGLKGKQQPSKAKYYRLLIDRDEVYRLGQRGCDVRQRLAHVGFEFMGSDY